METKNAPQEFNDYCRCKQESAVIENIILSMIDLKKIDHTPSPDAQIDLPEILFITSYPPRDCTQNCYSPDLINALNVKFRYSLAMKVCALESGAENFIYSKEVKHVLNISSLTEYEQLVSTINNNNHILMVLILYESEFCKAQEKAFHDFLHKLSKPLIIFFQLVQSFPDKYLKSKIIDIAVICENIIVTTNNEAEILMNDYEIMPQKIFVVTENKNSVNHINSSVHKVTFVRHCEPAWPADREERRSNLL